ncbi:MAG: UDP-3-O-(3-hydroxymyristoyl)glucosamine N-acyltransferase [Oligoflexia bacterium]|nr:UDP-3-O-(3-hydroxymyristoyl)glucosamine N-acyltransferase [Oligoflexia bacterium]
MTSIHISPCSLSDVLGWLSPVRGRLVNEASLSQAGRTVQIVRPAELAGSGPGDISFFFSKSYQTELLAAAPGILVTGEPFVQPLQASGLPLWKSSAIIACADPYLAMAICLEKLADRHSAIVHAPLVSAEETFIHPTAIVSPRAEIGAGTQIGPHCVIEDGVKIGTGCILYPGCYFGVGVSVGKDCVFFSRVTLYEKTKIGDRARIHAGAVLGADGFGFVPKITEGRPLGYQKIYHFGRVVVGNDVEIGANSCVDRGTLGDTRIDHHAKIDDLVMVGHNCWVEEGAILCGKAGLAGRAHVGKYAMIGGAAGLSNDVHVGDGAKVAAHCLVSKDVPPGMTVVGNPHREQREHFKIQALLNRMIARRGEKTK